MDKLSQFQSLMTAFENGQPVSDELKLLGSERLRDLRRELEEQIKASKESGGAILPEKLATLEGLRGLVTDLMHGTLQSYLMDTLIGAQEQRLRMVQEQAGSPTETPRRRSAVRSAFDTPPASSTPKTNPPPKETGFIARMREIGMSMMTFFGGLLGKAGEFFSGLFGKKKTKAPERQTSTPPAEPAANSPAPKTPDELYNEDPPQPSATMPQASPSPAQPTTTPPPEPEPEPGPNPESTQTPLPALIDFSEFRNGIEINGRHVTIISPNIVDVDGRRWKLTSRSFDVNIDKVEWKNEGLTIQASASNPLLVSILQALRFETSGSKTLDLSAAMALLDYLATSRDPKVITRRATKRTGFFGNGPEVEVEEEVVTLSPE